MSILPKSRKARRRLMVLAIAAPVLALAVGLTLYAMRDAVVFFYGPSQAQAEHVPAGRTVRIGGLVQPGSVIKASNGEVKFAIADQANAVPTTFKGELPDLFREGQGVVAQGEFDRQGVFVARQVLAKHDEKYMPKEVVDALKKSGEWQRDGAAPGKPVAEAGPAGTGAL
ncbi:MAG: CcmE/CycJ protein [Caulobacteraceae bacterium]|jgi:cytochrome c-type biogenesis protein CcmE|nr:CcmE/CycJ protein [Caulobacteraceae bacterium]